MIMIVSVNKIRLFLRRHACLRWAPSLKNDLLWLDLAAFRTCNRNTDCHADTVPILEELPVSVKLAFTWRGGQLAAASF
jgi:hypothetical protein